MEVDGVYIVKRQRNRAKHLKLNHHEKTQFWGWWDTASGFSLVRADGIKTLLKWQHMTLDLTSEGAAFDWRQRMGALHKG